MLVEILGGVSALLLIVLIIVIAYYSRKVSQLNKKITEVQLNSQQQAQQMFNINPKNNLSALLTLSIMSNAQYIRTF
jgi:hypothetical protein